MAGPNDDPETVDVKLDRILAQLTTMNNRLDAHDRRIARTEKFQAGEADSEVLEDVPPNGSHCKSGGGSSEGGGGGGGGLGGAHRDHSSNGAGHHPPRPPKLSFPKYDGEEDPLLWLNNCEIFFRGHSTME
ncbi:unnamed protein product [Urochloa humidicola]